MGRGAPAALGPPAPVLPDWAAPPADIHAVYLSRDQLSAKVRAFVDFLAEHFSGHDARERYAGW